MTQADNFTNSRVNSGFWSWDVSSTPGDGSPGSATVIVNSLPAGDVTLDGDITAAGDPVTVTFADPNGSRFTLDLNAVFDIAGAVVLTDGSSLYVFSSFHLEQGKSYHMAQGFGHFGDRSAEAVACFVSQTALLTASGPVFVEDLRLGDLLVTKKGTLEPVRWIGWRHVNTGYHANRPVVIAKGAFGEGEPAVDLWLSPNHSVFCEKHLIPVRHLVNGSTITWPDLEQPTVYYHVELDRHDVVFASGLAVESFLNTSGRDDFTFQFRSPDWIEGEPANWAAHGYAPLALVGATVQRVRKRVRRQSWALGHRRTTDANLLIMVGDVPQVGSWDGTVWNGTISAGSDVFRLLSSSFVPRDGGSSTDGRLLGTAVAGVTLNGATLNLDRTACVRGWHVPENGFRWTNGNAIVRNPAIRGGGKLRVETVQLGSYASAPMTLIAGQEVLPLSPQPNTTHAIPGCDY